MKLILYFSSVIMPFTIAVIIIAGIYRGVDVFEAFIEGAKDGAKTVVAVFPSLLGLMAAVAVLRQSGFLECLTGIISPITSLVGFPAEALPVALMRLVSNSAAMSMVFDIFKSFGPDSFVGRLVSIMMGSTETVFYTLSVYTAGCGISDTKYALKGAVIASIAGVAASFVICTLLW